MVKKRRKILTHVILILVCIVVLFPIVWVVSTSLRRDNAAFSTKMFSSRLTFQNYIDLLAPEKNGPRLVSDIDALVLSAPPHDKATVEEANKLFSKDIQKFKEYIKETEELKMQIDKSIQAVRDYFEQNSDKLVSSFSNNLDSIVATLNFEKPEEYLGVAAYELYNNGVDLSTLSEINDVFSGKNDWERMIGDKKNQAEKLKTRIDELTAILEPLEKSYASQQSQFTNQINTIKTLLLPQLKEYSKVLNSLTQILESAKDSEAYAEFLPDEEFIMSKFTETLSEIANLKLETEKYADLQEIDTTVSEFQKLYRKVLSKWRNFSYKDKAPYSDFLNTVDAFTTNVASTIKESVLLLNQLNSTTQKMFELQAQINQQSSNATKLKSQLDKLNNEIDEAYEKISQALVYLNAQVLKDQILEIKDRVSSLSLPSQLQLLNIQSKRVFGLVTDFAAQLPEGSKEQKNLRALVKNIDWPGTAKDMFTNYDLFVENYEPYMSELKMYLGEAENQGPEFITVSKNGIKVRPQSLERLTDVVLSTYRNNVVPNMNVMSRKATDLSDKLGLKDISKSLKTIDGAAFRIDQIWQRKPDHYLLRWIMNSIIVALSVSLITTAVTALAAYPFSRMRFKGRKYGIMFLLLIQMFPAIMYMIAIYTFLAFAGKYIPGFGLSKISGLVFAYLGGIAYNMYLIKGYYDTIPDSLEEAALIDGATRWQTFVKIVLPLASPILAVIVILTFMSTFNEFVLAKIILQDVKQYTYAVGLYTFSTGPFETEWGLFTAAALIGMVPMVVLFLLMQKYIVGGLVSGAVKG